MIKKSRQDLEEAIKEKVSPLLEETMEKQWGVTIPKLEADISDKLRQPLLNIYISSSSTFSRAKKFFRKEFLKRELRLHRGNVSQLAKLLGLDRRSIHRSIKDLDIDVEKIRLPEVSPTKDMESAVDQTIRTALDQYKELIKPQKMEQMYGEIEKLSRNIALTLPHPELTWKEAEEEFERQFLVQALKEHQFNVTNTAKDLSVCVETLSRKIKKLGLRPRE